MSATQFKHDCPYCGAVKAGFEFVFLRRERGNEYKCQGMAVCGVCDKPVLIRYLDLTMSGNGRPFNLVETSADFPNKNMHVKEITPKGGTDVPDRLPANVLSYYRQGMLNESSGHWDAAGAMFRKALDVATKALDPALAKKSLFERIESLTEQGRITSDLSVWAHEIRIEGNSAVHDEEPETREDVAAIHEFCRAVLLYTFTFPALVAERSSRSLDGAGQAA